MSVSSNFKKTLDKSAEREYNGIVNSKGAADMESVAPFLVYSAKFHTQWGVSCSASGTSYTLLYSAVIILGGFLYGSDISNSGS